MVDVKESMIGSANKSSFIKKQGVDIDAACKRIAITKETLEQFREKINATNTVDIAGVLKSHYDKVEEEMKLIILEEQILISISQGE